MLVTLVIVFLVGALWVVCQRLYWHPLRKIPGPLLAGLTGWWEFYFDVIEDGTLVKRLPQLHREYSKESVLHHEKNLSLRDRNLCHSVYRAGTDYGKAPHFYKALIYPEALISIMDAKRHRVYRNTIAPLFSPAAIELCTPRIYDVVHKAAEKISNGYRTGMPVDVQRLFRAISVDVIYVTLFGQPDEFVKTYERDHGLIQCSAWVEGVQERRRHGQLTTPDGITTIFDAMLTPSEEKGYKERTPKELIDEAALFILAGSDTSAYSLSTATYYLLSNPKAQEMLQAELSNAERFIREKNWEETRKLPYLMAVIKETLRLSTPVPGITPRIVPEPGVKVQGHFLPAGTIVSITHRSIHDNPELYSTPTEFKPERWLGEKGKALDRWLVAFSKGSRQCVGSPLAYQELALTIAHLFGRFEMELHETNESSMEWVDNVVAVNKEPVQVKVLRDRWA
ncbi:hypothetical protein BDV06DRAFT_216933 [Aspergillus oleicola]